MITGRLKSGPMQRCLIFAVFVLCLLRGAYGIEPEPNWRARYGTLYEAALSNAFTPPRVGSYVILEPRIGHDVLGILVCITNDTVTIRKRTETIEYHSKDLTVNCVKKVFRERGAQLCALEQVTQERATYQWRKAEEDRARQAELEQHRAAEALIAEATRIAEQNRLAQGSLSGWEQPLTSGGATNPGSFARLLSKMAQERSDYRTDSLQPQTFSDFLNALEQHRKASEGNAPVNMAPDNAGIHTHLRQNVVSQYFDKIPLKYRDLILVFGLLAAWLVLLFAIPAYFQKKNWTLMKLSNSSGMLLFVITGLVSFCWSLLFIMDRYGLIGGLAAVFIFPVAIALTPLYIGFAKGEWMLFLVTYGGWILSALLFHYGEKKAEQSPMSTKHNN